MKIQILSTLAQQKYWQLLLLTSLWIKKIEAGQALKNCLLTEYSDRISYEVMINFIPSLMDKGANYFCCDKAQCIAPTQATCIEPNAVGFWWGGRRDSQNNIYSVQVDKQRGPRCYGILGDTPITKNATVDFCYYRNLELAYVANFIASVKPVDMTGINNGYATYFCPNPFCSQNFTFGWDNGGWLANTWSYDCNFQWPAPWPGPADKNPFYIPINNNHLVEKIAIPVGVLTGTGALGGAYYLHKKKKRRQQTLMNDNLKLEEIEKKEENLNSQSSIQTHSHSMNPHTEYFGIIEEAHNPQLINN